MKKKSLEKSLCNFETKKMLTNLVPLNFILDVYVHIRERIVRIVTCCPRSYNNGIINLYMKCILDAIFIYYFTNWILISGIILKF